MDNKDFWNRVKFQIRAHKLSQSKFAEYIGIKPRTFQGWIYHNRIPVIEIGVLIAAALGVDLEYLVLGKDDKIMQIRARQVKERKIAAAKITKMIELIQKEIMRV